MKIEWMSFRDAPISRKLKFVIMSTTVLSIMLVVAGFVVYEYISFRNILINEISTKAEIIGQNCSAALLFANNEDAEKILRILQTQPRITKCAIYSKEGKLFARYARDMNDGNIPQFHGTHGAQFAAKSFSVFLPIRLNGIPVGTIYLESDLERLNQRLVSYGSIAALVLIISLLCAYGIGSLLEQRISKPILALANTARLVTERQDYSVRIDKISDDEIGTFAQSFNDMLKQIQLRDEHLQKTNASMAQEILERKKVEEALRESEGRFRTMANSIPQLAWSAHPDGYIYWYNQRWFEYTGTTMEQMEGWGWQAVHDPLVLPNVVARWKESIETGSFFEMEFPLKGADSAYHPFLTRVMPLKDAEGNVLQWFGTNTDLSEIKKAEEKIKQFNLELEQRVHDRTVQLETANKELEAFSYSVSHDLRAPLRHIDGYVQLLERKNGNQLNDTGKRYLKVVSDAAKRMGDLIDDLIVFSRMSRTEMKKMQTDFNVMIQQIIEEFSGEIGKRIIHWHIASLPMVRGDASMLKLVWTNLIANAIKYTRSKIETNIQIGSAVADDEDIFFIKDNGVGFEMQYVDKLFGVFQRLHQVQDFEGTGIGLANVRRIVHRHGGRTWAEGEINEGASFYFSLPKYSGQSNK